jgi:hypothetical protein
LPGLLLLLSGSLLGCLFSCSLGRLLCRSLLGDPLLFSLSPGFFLPALCFGSLSCRSLGRCSLCGCLLGSTLLCRSLLCDPLLFGLASGCFLPALRFPGCGCLLGFAPLFRNRILPLLLIVVAHRWGGVIHLVFTAWVI